jgi:hypothetical protein
MMKTALRPAKTASDSTAKNQALFIPLSLARAACVSISLFSFNQQNGDPNEPIARRDSQSKTGR